jgi:hypothetical protein
MPVSMCAWRTHTHLRVHKRVCGFEHVHWHTCVERVLRNISEINGDLRNSPFSHSPLSTPTPPCPAPGQATRNVGFAVLGTVLEEVMVAVMVTGHL